MQQEPNVTDANRKMGKWMMIFAWVLGLGFLTLFFEQLLSKQFNPNQSPSSQHTQQGVEVTLQQNRMGHYVASGFINNIPVTFLLDTGATDVSVPYDLAVRLGMQPGRRQLATTANGTIQVAQSRINHLQLGEIHLYDLDASMNPGMNGDKILLGMSALRQLEFTQRGEWLILRQY